MAPLTTQTKKVASAQEYSEDDAGNEVDLSSMTAAERVELGRERILRLLYSLGAEKNDVALLQLQRHYFLTYENHLNKAEIRSFFMKGHLQPAIQKYMSKDVSIKTHPDQTGSLYFRLIRPLKVALKDFDYDSLTSAMELPKQRTTMAKMLVPVSKPAPINYAINNSKPALEKYRSKTATTTSSANFKEKDEETVVAVSQKPKGNPKTVVNKFLTDSLLDMITDNTSKGNSENTADNKTKVTAEENLINLDTTEDVVNDEKDDDVSDDSDATFEVENNDIVDDSSSSSSSEDSYDEERVTQQLEDDDKDEIDDEDEKILESTVNLNNKPAKQRINDYNDKKEKVEILSSRVIRSSKASYPQKLMNRIISGREQQEKNDSKNKEVPAEEGKITGKKMTNRDELSLNGRPAKMQQQSLVKPEATTQKTKNAETTVISSDNSSSRDEYRLLKMDLVKAQLEQCVHHNSVMRQLSTVLTKAEIWLDNQLSETNYSDYDGVEDS